MTLNQQETSRFSKSFLMISFITIAALIGLGIKDFTCQKEQVESHFSSYCESTSNRLGTILTTPLWNFELNRLKEISNVEMKDQQMIHSISIFEKTAVTNKQMIVCITKDDSGQLINCQGNPGCSNIKKTRKLIKNDILIGNIEICFSQKTIDQQIQKILRDVMVRLFFVIVIVLAGLFMAMRSLVK